MQSPRPLPDARLVAAQPIGVRQGSVCAHRETERGERGGERQRVSKRERGREGGRGSGVMRGKVGVREGLKKQPASLPQQCLSARAVKCADKTAHFVDTKHCE